MPKQNDAAYYAKRADDARAMAERATTPAARTIHLALAAKHDAKALAASSRGDDKA
jgi:hypothetical protein